MTTIHSIIREALDRVNSHTAASLDAIATDAEAAIRALLVSDAAVERAGRAFLITRNATQREDVDGITTVYDVKWVRAALEAALKEEG